MQGFCTFSDVSPISNDPIPHECSTTSSPRNTSPRASCTRCTSVCACVCVHECVRVVVLVCVFVCARAMRAGTCIALCARAHASRYARAHMHRACARASIIGSSVCLFVRASPRVSTAGPQKPGGSAYREGLAVVERDRVCKRVHVVPDSASAKIRATSIRDARGMLCGRCALRVGGRCRRFMRLCVHAANVRLCEHAAGVHVIGPRAITGAADGT